MNQPKSLAIPCAMVVACVLLGRPPGDASAPPSGKPETTSPTLANAPPTAPTDPLPPGASEAVATVNGQSITRQQLNEAMQNDLTALQGQGKQLTAGERSALQQRWLGRLIDQELLSQAAAHVKVDDLDKKVDAQIRAIKVQLPSGQTLDDLIAKAGRTQDQFRADVRKQVVRQEFIEQQFGSKVQISDEQIQAFYDRHPSYFQTPDMVRASHILVSVPQGATDEVKKAKRAVIEQARQRVLKGENFAKVARELSDDPGTKHQGGDLEFFARGRMVPEFERAAFALKSGEVSEVVTTEFGYHIIKQTAAQPAQKRSLKQVKAIIERFLKDREVGKLVSQFLEDQRKTAKIETFLK